MRLVDRVRNRLGRKVELVGPKFLGDFAKAYPAATFIEIGAHDGAGFDQLRSFILDGEWTGVMVEPSPDLFERLRRNYEAIDRVAVENAAISDADGSAPFYQLPPVENPEA